MIQLKSVKKPSLDEVRKVKVYLSYHPEDKAEFKKICDDILSVYDCEILYTEKNYSKLSVQEKISLFQEIQLFVFAVTNNLLNKPCNAEQDYSTANVLSIDVLPIIIGEVDIDNYQRKFDGCPYLSPTKTYREIGYKERLLTAVTQSIYKSITVLEDLEEEYHIMISDEDFSWTEEACLFTEKLASAYLIQEDYENALVHYRQLYVTYKTSLYGEKHPKTLKAMQNYVRCIWGTEEDSEIEIALELAKELYTLCREVLGEEHPDTISSLSLLGDCYGDAENEEKRIECKQKAYDLTVKVFGQYDTFTIDALESLSYAYSQRIISEEFIHGEVDDFSEIRATYEKLYELKKEVWGIANSTTIDCLEKIASFYYYNPKYKREHAELSEKIANILLDYYGVTFNTCERLNSAAFHYEDLGDYDKALELFTRLYKYREEELGEKDVYTIRALFNIGEVYIKQENYLKAVCMFKNVLSLYLQSIGKNNYAVMCTHERLIEAFDKWKKYDKALFYRKELLGISLEVRGADHPKTRQAMRDLCYGFMLTEQYEDALLVLEPTRKIELKNGKKESLEYREILHMFAVCHDYLNELEKAIAYFEEIITCYEDIEEDYEDKLTSLYGFCVILKKVDDWKRVVEYLQEIYDYAVKTLGEDDEQTKKLKQELDEAKSKL